MTSILDQVALSGMGRMELTRSIMKLRGMRKREKSRVLLRFGYLVTKKNPSVTEKAEGVARLGMKEKVTSTPRNPEG